jgi:hypothetical protein
MNDECHFILQAVDKAGNSVDISHYRPNSLLAAALVGHAFQIEDGYVVTIVDRSEMPPKKYGINRTGKPVPL